MTVTAGCGPLFDAFVAAGLNTKQIMQNLGAIVQNDGVHLTAREIEDWAVEATQQLMEDHRIKLSLIDSTLKAFKGMPQ